MAFSQSFELGNSTIMDLENEVNRAINYEDLKENKALDIILESPTSKLSSTLSCTRSKTRLFTAATQYLGSENSINSRRFKRSKSDSTLPRAPTQTQQNDLDNYSQLFRSDFSIQSDISKEEQRCVLQVSQIKEAFKCDSYIEQESSGNKADISFERPVFSEDLKAFLETEKNGSMLKDSMLSSAVGDNDPPDILQEVSFICPIKDDDILKEQHLNKELEESRKILREFQQQQEIMSERNISLSCMSPDQLQFTQDVSSQVKKNITFNSGAKNEEKQDTEIIETIPTIRTTEIPIENLEALKSMKAWNLPLSVLNEYEKKGVKNMFDWQIQCLSNPKVIFEHCNLVYSAPTSAGKTLVSEILLLKTVLERSKKVLLILPFISVVREKMIYLQDLLTSAGYRVEGFFGGYTPPGGFDSINVAICTIEKANSIVNKLLEQGKLNEIGTVVVDEVHLISDPGRGYILELLLAKILYMSRKYGLQIQIITMSATLPNVELLKKWLNAELYITDFRPVALHEMIKIGNKIYDNSFNFLRSVTDTYVNVNEPFPALQNDTDHVAQLCIETLLDGCSVVVFCPSKDWCENLAIQLASSIHFLGKQGGEWGTRLRAQINRQTIDNVKQQLRDIPTGLDAVLDRCITYGCSFHHAGLTTEERDIVEASFKSGALKVIVATSTLSSGVNLPARRVLIRSPFFGGKQMNSLTYRQMIGRAGRTGKDVLGESILICTESNARVGKELITADLRPLNSCLDLDNSTHLKRALLEVISSGVATSKEDIENFVNCTLLSAQKELGVQGKERNHPEITENAHIGGALDFLLEYEFIRLQENEESHDQHYVATRLGNACLASSMPPTDGLILFAELQKSRRCFVLESELHAVYLVTPYSVCYQLQDLDWLLYLDLWEKLTPAMKKVGELVGVKESFLVRAMRGQMKLDYKLMQIHKRFYIALALQELVNETPINTVALKYKCTRGMLQGLQQMASSFAGIVTSFCNSLQWDTLSLIVSQFKERLYFGIHRDLIDLMRLPDLNHKRARILFDAGVTTLIELASSDVLYVEKILYNALSFDSVKKQENENDFEAAKRNEARNFFITGKTGITVAEAAKLLVKEARRFVQYEIGVGNINWSQSVHDKDLEKYDVNKEMHMSYEENKFPNYNLDRSGTISKDNEQFCDQRQLDKDKIVNGNSITLFQNEIHDEKENVNKTQHKNITDLQFIKPKDELAKNNNVHCNKTANEKHTTEEKGNLHNESQYTSKQKYMYEAETLKGEIIKSKCKNIEINSKEKSPLLKDSKSHKKTIFHENTMCLENKELFNPINKRRSLEKNAAILDTTSPKTMKVSNESGHKIKSISSVATEYENLVEKKDTEEKPSTSTKAQRLLRAKQLSEIKKQEWAKRSDFQLNQPLTISETETTLNVKIKAPDKKFNILKKPRTKNSPKTPTSILNTEMQEAPKLPRRSPRNHLISSTRIEESHQSKKSSHSELFDTEGSFTIHSGIREVLRIADNLNENDFKENINNSREDEIPNSQQMREEKPAVNSNTPYSSRFLRSIRATQKIQSPKTIPVIEATKMQKPDKPHEISAPSSPKSVELSDFSMENSLIKNPIHLNASHILSCSEVDTDSSSFKSLDLIDICGNLQLFKGAFKEFMAQKRLGFCLGIQKQCGKRKPLIGSNLLVNQIAATERENEETKTYEFQLDDESYLAGISFCISENVVYYMNMQQEGSCRELTDECKCKYLRLLLKSTDCCLLIYDAKEQIKTLRRIFEDIGDIQVSIEDPKVANWLLQPDKSLNLYSLAQQFAPECSSLVSLCGSGRGFTSYGLDSDSAILAKVRSSIEACVTIHILKGQTENLERIGTGQLHKFFTELEMPLQMALCNMEDLGFPTNSDALQKLFQQMVDSMKKLELKIYEVHGSKFNLGSSSAVARVLGLHRKSNGRISTSKQILEKIDSPISQMILTYRKLSTTLTKNVQPLLKSVRNERIHGQSITFTSTGRISMAEPNLQNVAKDFEVINSPQKNTKISCRSAFFPRDPKRCLISADFCQLEMRILAHLSQDTALLQVMKSEKDLFVAIAARWNKISENSVTEQLRNGTKQICYGIVYGMGMRALAESLKCTEQEAKIVSEQFHAAYPAIRLYTEKVVKFARHNGYVETITGRRRYLENICSEEALIKNQAERQAVNSTIQGSAADIAKSAILRMEKNILKYREKLGLEPNSVRLVLHLHDELIFEVPEDKAKKVAKVLSLTMENCVKLNVPLKVKLKIGRSWGELKELKL